MSRLPQIAGVLAWVALVFSAVSCARLPADGAERETAVADVVECPETRPDFCVELYQPVCAERDTGVRCVTHPCDLATELVTMSNGCAACMDPAVHRFRPNACGEANPLESGQR